MLGASGKIFRIYHLFSAYGTESLFSLVLFLLLLLLLSFFCLVSLRFAKGVQKIFCKRFSKGKESKNSDEYFFWLFCLVLRWLVSSKRRQINEKHSFIYFVALLRFDIRNKEKNKVTFCLPNFNMATGNVSFVLCFIHI